MSLMYEKAEYYNTQGTLECSESNIGERKFHAMYVFHYFNTSNFLSIDQHVSLL